VLEVERTGQRDRSAVRPQAASGRNVSPASAGSAPTWRVFVAALLRCEGRYSCSITERRVPELIPVLVSQPAGDVSHKPDGRLPLLPARPAVTLATLKRADTNFAAW